MLPLPRNHCNTGAFSLADSRLGFFNICKGTHPKTPRTKVADLTDDANIVDVEWMHVSKSNATPPPRLKDQ